MTQQSKGLERPPCDERQNLRMALNLKWRDQTGFLVWNYRMPFFSAFEDRSGSGIRLMWQHPPSPPPQALSSKGEQPFTPTPKCFLEDSGPFSLKPFLAYGDHIRQFLPVSPD